MYALSLPISFYFRKDSALLHFICLALWNDNPSLLYEFVSKAIEKLNDGLVGYYCAVSRPSGL